MSVFAVRLPDDLKAAAQAGKAGLSLNQYSAPALSARVGAQAEAERFSPFTACEPPPAKPWIF